MNFAALSRTLRRHSLWTTLKNLTGFFFARLKDTQIQEVASSMTLTTLLSLIPLLAVSLAVFAAFPSFASSRAALEAMILQSFLPPQYSEQIVHYLKVFMTQASGLGIFGLAGLAVTALLLIDKFFVTINSIFKVRRLRPWPQRALIYWGMLTLAPAAIFLSLTMSKQAIEIAMSGVEAPSFFNTLYFWGQVLLQGLGYSVLYKFVPNCRVPAQNALIGGLSVAIVGQVVKTGFETYVTAGTLSNVYGAFVAIPVFVLWVYVAWYLFFAGAAIAATIPKLTAGRFLDYYRPGNEFLTALAMLRELVHLRLRQKRPILDVEELCDAADTYPEAAERILSRLAEAGYVAPVTTEAGGRTQEWVLVADSQKTTLLRAFEFFAVSGGNSLVSSKMQRLAGKDGAVGILADWWKQFSTNEALNRPMAQLFALPGDEEESVSDGSLRNNSSRIQKS